MCKGIAVLNQSRANEIERDLVEMLSKAISKRFSLEIEAVVVPKQIHGNTVLFVDSAENPAPLRCDALVTEKHHLALGITVADCIPLFAYDLEGRIAGISHCGWRGIASGIVERFVETFIQRGFKPHELVFVIGPAIGVCCYEVGDDLLGNFPAREVEKFSLTRDGKRFIDLKAIVASRLASSGAKRDAILVDATCTSCSSENLPSYRRCGGNCGRMLAFVALRPQ